MIFLINIQLLLGVLLPIKIHVFHNRPLLSSGNSNAVNYNMLCILVLSDNLSTFCIILPSGHLSTKYYPYLRVVTDCVVGVNAGGGGFWV